jgi:mannose-6-phosphate isomerase-like protein (cupin superfamily)
VLEATVGPGDFLLIPVGWWHTVESLSTSISLSFHNFAVDGSPVVWRWRESAARPKVRR